MALHAGIRLPDLEIPAFVFVMGFSMALSLESQRSKSSYSRLGALGKVWQRVAVLLLLNLFYNGVYQQWDTLGLRIPGVLFRLVSPWRCGVSFRGLC